MEFSQRSNRGKNSKRQPKNAKKYFLVFMVLLMVLFLIILAYFYIFFGYRRMNIAVSLPNGDAEVVSFDPDTKSVVRIFIPGDTQVSASRHLGKWRLKSIWKLGEDEGGAGNLLMTSITKSFKFPIDSWSESGIDDFFKMNVFSFLRALFSNYKSNLSFTDRLRMGVYILVHGNISKFDLSDSSYLEKRVLSDGDWGYMITSRMPDKVAAVFADPMISQAGVSIIIVNSSSGDDFMVRTIGDTLEMLGPKVVATFDENIENFDCRITGANGEVLKRIARVFQCNVLERKGNDNDKDSVKVYLGEEFFRRY
jgi:hypothetical protein